VPGSIRPRASRARDVWELRVYLGRDSRGKDGGAGSRRRVCADVLDQAGDVLWDESADCAAGIDADDDFAVGSQHKTGGLQVHGVGVDEGSGGCGDGLRVGPVADGER